MSSNSANRAGDAQAGEPRLKIFETSGGAVIYQLPLELFPWMWGYAYLIHLSQNDQEEQWVLIDCGSGLKDSNRRLDEGLEAVGGLVGRPVSYGDLSYVLITHGHIDHFGGLGHIIQNAAVPIGIHELDKRILTHYEERLVIVDRRLDEFLIEAGVGSEDRLQMMEMYRLNKSLFHSIPVQFTYETGGMRKGPFEMLHVPGHTAGHVAIRLHNVIFCGDHVLSGTSPHMAPERLTLSTGLEHYLRSLNDLVSWAEGSDLVLGGHNEPIEDLPARVEAIREVHRERLAKILDLLDEPRSIAEVSRTLFGEVHGYHKLLAVEEAGAHIEYLYQRGLLEIGNLADLERESSQGTILYCRTKRQDGV